MKKAISILLALSLVCSMTLPGYAAETQAAEATETTEATEETRPKPETGVIQADGIPAILAFLQEGDQVEVTEELDERNSLVEAEHLTGMLETQLLRFPWEPDYECWLGYARYNTALYDNYALYAEPELVLNINKRLLVVDETEDFYAVTLQQELPKEEEATEPTEETQATEATEAAEATQAPETEELPEEEFPVYYVDKDKVSKYPSSSGGGSGSSGGGGGFEGQDGGDISMAYYGLSLLTQFTEATEETEPTEPEKIGPAQVRVRDAMLIAKYFQKDEVVKLVTEEGLVPEIEGYLAIELEEGYAYVPEGWVLPEGEEPYESWAAFAGYDCELFDNYQLRWESVKRLYLNTRLTVLWDDGFSCLVQLDDEEGTLGFIRLDKALKSPATPSKGSSGNSGGSGVGDWTPPVL